jgi:hypothetical protein
MLAVEDLANSIDFAISGTLVPAWPAAATRSRMAIALVMAGTEL